MLDKFISYILYFVKCVITNILFLMKKIIGHNIKYHFTVTIAPFATVKFRKRGRMEFGKYVTLGPNTEVSVAGGTIIFEGNNYVNRNTMIVAHDSIKIGRGTTIGPNVMIYDHDHNIGSNSDSVPFISQPIEIGQNVWIGAGAIILKGVRIGDNSVIGAGAVITNNIEDNQVVVQKRINTIKPRE